MWLTYYIAKTIVWLVIIICYYVWLISVPAYRLGLQIWCYSRYILQASLDKNSAQDATKHAISN